MKPLANAGFEVLAELLAGTPPGVVPRQIEQWVREALHIAASGGVAEDDVATIRAAHVAALEVARDLGRLRRAAVRTTGLRVGGGTRR